MLTLGDSHLLARWTRDLQGARLGLAANKLHEKVVL